MSDPRPRRIEEGVGCRPFVIGLLALVVFAAITATVGIAMFRAEGAGAVMSRLGPALYGAGLPVSALFAVAAGNDLPVAPFTDVIVWIAAAALVARYAERRSIPLWRPLAWVMAAALVYGALISLLIQRA